MQSKSGLINLDKTLKYELFCPLKIPRWQNHAPFEIISEIHWRCHLGRFVIRNCPVSILKATVRWRNRFGGTNDLSFCRASPPPLRPWRCAVCTCEKWRPVAVYVIFVVIGPCRINLNFHHSLVLCQWVYSRFKL